MLKKFIKFPFNNSCDRTNNINVGFPNFAVDVSTLPLRHVKKLLPPTLTDCPGAAEIRYYVKVTVARPSILKGNPRAFVAFNFLPIEPPRPAGVQNVQIYARREPIFHRDEQSNPAGQKGGLIDTLLARRSSVPSSSAAGELPRFIIDARLPNPAIIIRNKDIPLKVVFKQLNKRTEVIYLDSFQVELIGYTKIRSQDIGRTESQSWLIVSRSNMALPIGNVDDAAGTETALKDDFWRDRPLANSVCPSFETCNISRHYELETRVEVRCGLSKSRKVHLTSLRRYSVLGLNYAYSSPDQ